MMPLRNTNCPRTGSKHTDHTYLMLLANLLPCLLMRTEKFVCHHGFEQPALLHILKIACVSANQTGAENPLRKIKSSYP